VLDEVLGLDDPGRLTHDGWAPCDALTRATHPPCRAHLLRRARDGIDRLVGRAQRFPTAMNQLWHDARALRDRGHAAAILPHGFAGVRGRLARRIDDRLARPPRNPVHRRCFDHLARHRWEILAFRYDDERHATNGRAEQALRPAVVHRKVFGGNRTAAGAQALEVLASLFATGRQHGRDALDYLSSLLRLSPTSDPVTLPLPLPPALA
jgi:transposase